MLAARAAVIPTARIFVDRGAAARRRSVAMRFVSGDVIA
jgi:hypothetical protein